MTRQTQTILYHLLPIAFWLLAAGGALLPVFLLPLSTFNSQLSTLNYFLPAVLVLIAVLLLTHIKRHASAVEPAFLVAVLLGVASCWLPTVVFLILPAWIYLAYRHLIEWRVIWATLIGLALVAIWVAVFVYFGLIETPSLEGRAGVGFLSWIPVGAFLVAYIASAVVRHNLRVR
ncbi:MAG: hypothetical protein IJ602_03155 [Paludibacteraceae bacterium]|nr:hypothetical protein [Paludibacteraceae bacterium]